MQWDETEGKGRDDAFYGGAGYGGKNSRPDLSNTAFFMEALRDTGLPADDPSLQKALVFVSRCQNLKSEFNDQAWAGKVNDGGFIYTAAQGGSSIAGKEANGGSPVVCQHDLRRAQEHDLRRALSRGSPGQGGPRRTSRTTTRSTRTRGWASRGCTTTITPSPRPCRCSTHRRSPTPPGCRTTGEAELLAALAKRQQADGSWVNPADRFMEGDPTWSRLTRSWLWLMPGRERRASSCSLGRNRIAVVTRAPSARAVWSRVEVLRASSVRSARRLAVALHPR